MRPLRWGRAKNGNFLGIWPRFHIIVFGKDKFKAQSAIGLTIKFRYGTRWSCWTIKFLEYHKMDRKRWIARQKHTNKRYQSGKIQYPAREGGIFYARGTITLFEIEHWHTRGDSHTRVGLKSYLRLRFCPGGRQA
jgi:hypothetical protein